jgi:aspartyl protease family protein
MRPVSPDLALMNIPMGPLILAVVVCVGGYTVAQKFAADQDLGKALALAPPPLAQAPAADDEPVLSGTLKIQRKSGQFELEARIGTHTAPFVVDTGASIVALTWDTGYNLGLASIGDVMDAKMSTANGTVMGKFVTISRIEAGTLRVENIKAVVLPKGALAQNLLGMSFLNRLRTYSVAGSELTLTQ